MTPCISFSISTSAGLYSTLSGVLAGFAFLALSVLLTPGLTQVDLDEEGRRSLNSCAIILIATFVSLVLTSFLYGVIAGENNNCRAATEELFSATTFTVSADLFFYSIILLLEHHHRGVTAGGAAQRPKRSEAHSFLVTAASRVAMPVLFIFVSTATSDYQEAKYGEHHLNGPLVVLILVLILAMLLAAARPLAAALLMQRLERRLVELAVQLRAEFEDRFGPRSLVVSAANHAVPFSEARSRVEADKRFASRVLTFVVVIAGLQGTMSAFAPPGLRPHPLLVACYLVAIFILQLRSLLWLYSRFAEPID